MKQNYKQAGISAIDFICYIVTALFVLIVCIKVVPSYYEAEFLMVDGLEALRDKSNLKELDRAELKSNLTQHLSLNNVRGPAISGIKVVRYDDGYLVNADYKIHQDLFANFDLVMHYRYQLNTSTKICCEYLIENVED